MTAADLARVDVPLPELIRQVDEMAALKREASRTQAVAENRHLLYDADPDATVPPFVDLHHHETTRRRAS
ncbi:hypothetical protein ACIREK_31160 [Streptomyces sp. NPDC102415]|uniref:hypothetical protein n=1 Tax=Streptomyces sp. NPDC102415 TaxID=3366173 RepID=UPI003824DF75